MDRQSNEPRVALIGCGAIARSFYMPALRRHKHLLRNLILVDAHHARARALAEEFGVVQTTDSHQSLLGRLDAAIVATPAPSHHGLCKHLLDAGVHVLCEKPLTITRAQGQELIELATRKNLHLAVNNTRRLFPACQKIKSILDAGELGTLRSIRYAEGGEFAWPAATASYFKADQGQPRGVLQDRGAHVLDLICWWLAAKPVVIESLNDSYGGAECLAHIALDHRGCRCEIRLSWLGKLENRCELVGDHGRMVHNIYDWKNLDLTSRDAPPRTIRLHNPARQFADFAQLLVSNFLEAVAGRGHPLVTGADVLDSIELIDDCYRHANRFDMPWDQVFEAAHA